MNPYDQLIEEAAREFNLDPKLVRAIMGVESGGISKALSSKGALGLMQLMPETAKELGVTDRTDPRQSIFGGAKYIRQMLDRYDQNLDLALAAYNAGPGRVKEYDGVPPFKETQDYIRKIKLRLTRDGASSTAPSPFDKVQSGASTTAEEPVSATKSNPYEYRLQALFGAGDTFRKPAGVPEPVFRSTAEPKKPNQSLIDAIPHILAFSKIFQR